MTVLRVTRREFVATLGSAAAWPMVARAQQSTSRMNRIGVLMPFGKDDPQYRARIAAFLDGLRSAGRIDGQNVQIQYCATVGITDEIRRCATDLVGLSPTVIMATGVSTVVPLQQATHDIPIVFAVVPDLGAKSGAADVPIVFLTQVDPVPAGLVASLSHPGGNATGLYLVTADLLTKRIDLARQVAPDRSSIVLIVNRKGAEAEAQLHEADKVASDTGFQIQTRNASTPDEINIAFTAPTRPNAGAIIVGSDPLFFSQRDQIVALARREAIPVIYDRREYVTTGGLMSYGPNLADAFERLGLYAGKVLKGARPAELPVEQAARFEFVLNLKTARALGLSLKPTLLALADEVIE